MKTKVKQFLAVVAAFAVMMISATYIMDSSMKFANKVVCVSVAHAMELDKQLSIADTLTILHKGFKDEGFTAPQSTQNYDWKSLGWFEGYYLDYTAHASRAVVSHLLLQAMDLPSLKPVLYDVDYKSDPVFSVWKYGFTTEIGNYKDLVTYGELKQMITCAKDLMKQGITIPEPILASGVEIETRNLGQTDSIEYQQRAELSLMKLPGVLREDFSKRGYKIFLMDKDTYLNMWHNEWGDNRPSCACFSVQHKGIYSHIMTEDTLSHEFGHYLYQYFGDKDYCKIYEEELDQICELTKSEYSRTNIGEGFAEAYSCYITDDAALHANAPKTYAYITSLMDKVALENAMD